jgi:hypothetical protein
VFSDDHGHSWTQSHDVPTQALITRGCAFAAQRGVAGGHALVALTTADAGCTWQRVHYDGAQRPPSMSGAAATGRRSPWAPTVPTSRALMRERAGRSARSTPSRRAPRAKRWHTATDCRRRRRRVSP